MDLSLTPSDFRLLRDHLRGESAVEEVAFVSCSWSSTSDELRATHVELLTPGDFDIQTDFHVALAESVRPRLIKNAWDANSVLVEAHSHVDGDPAAFSRSDLAGFRDWVPHMLWRLSGRPYGALVFARETFDALIWTTTVDSPLPLRRLCVNDGQEFLPTNLTLRALGSAPLAEN